jgi:hypothetical protein
MGESRVFQVFYPWGTEAGIRRVSEKGYTLEAIDAPRTAYKQALDEFPSGPEPSCYVLLGDDPPGEERVYVGEGRVGHRLPIHDKDQKKAFWDRVVIFRSRDLTKDLAKYLESHLIDLANMAGQAATDQKTSIAPSLSPDMAVDAERFLEGALVLSEVLGISAFTVRSPQRATGAALILTGRGAQARGWETAEGRFLVEKMSVASKDLAPSAAPHITAARKRLLDAGILELDGDRMFITKDHEFPTPSNAAAVLLGMNADGLREWKREGDGLTLKQLREKAEGSSSV